MRIAAVFCVYNEREYLAYAVRAILPAVDDVLILLGTAPYTAYNPNARAVSRPDGTEGLVEQLAREDPKITVITGLWASEVDHRNAGLAWCLAHGADYYWLVDGDEVYREDHLHNIRQELQGRPRVGTFIIKCHIFWRSFAYRIPAGVLAWRPRRIFRVTRGRRLLGVTVPYRCRFLGQNETNSLGSVYEIPTDRAVFYHFSYARSSEAMSDKFRTFSHAHEIRQDWLKAVWEQWPTNRTMTNIHPIDPPKFPRAVHHAPDDLPAMLRGHPYYGLELIP